MADQKKLNHAVRDLKQLNAKEPDPSIINVQELRGRNVNDKLHATSIRPPPPGPVHVQSTVQTLDKKNLSLLPPINQSTPALVTAISPESSSDLDTDQGEALDETLRKVVQMFNQTILMTASLHLEHKWQSKTITTPQKDSYDADPIDHIGTDPIINFKRT